MKDDVDARIASAWREASDRLGVRVIAPYAIGPVSFVAHLPHFGGQRGMVIASLPSSDEVIAAAKMAGLYLSRVSGEYAEFDPDLFKETLDDWGWFGPVEDRPAWYSGAAWTT